MATAIFVVILLAILISAARSDAQRRQRYVAEKQAEAARLQESRMVEAQALEIARAAVAEYLGNPTRQKIAEMSSACIEEAARRYLERLPPGLVPQKVQDEVPFFIVLLRNEANGDDPRPP